MTKSDLVDEDWMELVTSDIMDSLKGTTLEDVRMVSVSSVSGEGLPKLLEALDSVLDGVEERDDNGHPRLPIDRGFYDIGVWDGGDGDVGRGETLGG